MAARMSFRPVPVKNPRKAPKAAFNAFFESLLSFISSPTKAPRNEPTIIPIGDKNIPMMIPTVQPIVPHLLPPEDFVKMLGKMLSRTVMMAAAIPVIIRDVVPRFDILEKCPTKSPAQASGGPGIGITAPTSPKTKRMNAKPIKT